MEGWARTAVANFLDLADHRLVTAGLVETGLAAIGFPEQISPLLGHSPNFPRWPFPNCPVSGSSVGTSCTILSHPDACTPADLSWPRAEMKESRKGGGGRG